MPPEWAALAGAGVVLVSLGIGASLTWWGAQAVIRLANLQRDQAIADKERAELNAKNAQPDHALDVATGPRRWDDQLRDALRDETDDADWET